MFPLSFNTKVQRNEGAKVFVLLFPRSFVPSFSVLGSRFATVRETWGICMRLPTLQPTNATAALDCSMIAAVRLLLASSLLFFIAPLEVDEHSSFLPLAIGYVCYGAVFFLWRAAWAEALGHTIWLDVGWAAALTAFSNESSVVYLFLFPTLLSAFHLALHAALRFQVVVMLLVLAINVLKSQQELDLTIYEIALPPLYLLVFGCLVIGWGHNEVASKRRLVLLREIMCLSNPRFGIDRMVGSMMERLRAFYDAETCLMVVTNPVQQINTMRSADRKNPERAIQLEVIPPETARLLVAPAPEQAIIYPGLPARWQFWRKQIHTYYVFDIRQGQRMTTEAVVDDSFITLLDAESFISVPIYYPDHSNGRLYLTATRGNTFTAADVSFLLHVIEQIVPVIENIRLLDQLASNAAVEERRRLARDIHDNVIQPYLGLQFGLTITQQTLATNAADSSAQIGKLLALTQQAIDSLRRYVQELPEAGAREHVLLATVQRYALAFSEATHIRVAVEVDPHIMINDRLAAEVFQMVVEGLSNIRWHTHAAHAKIILRQHSSTLHVFIINDGIEDAAPIAFTPWSISERAIALGGRVNIGGLDRSHTQVFVEIPL
jgi:signal transduction histidine kinase